jgi:hypothetical protein
MSVARALPSELRQGFARPGKTFNTEEATMKSGTKTAVQPVAPGPVAERVNRLRSLRERLTDHYLELAMALHDCHRDLPRGWEGPQPNVRPLRGLGAWNGLHTWVRLRRRNAMAPKKKEVEEKQTTLRLDPDLLIEAKMLAAREGTGVKELPAEGLRLVLKSRKNGGLR